MSLIWIRNVLSNILKGFSLGLSIWVLGLSLSILHVSFNFLVFKIKTSFKLLFRLKISEIFVHIILFFLIWLQ